MKPKISFLLIFFTLLAGCSTLAPDYHRPAAPVAAAWPGTAPAAAGTRPVAAIPWQEYFLAPQLRQVIDLALENNRDLRVALLNIERARAAYRIQRAELFPQLDGTASSTARHLPADLSGSGREETTHQYNVGLGVWPPTSSTSSAGCAASRTRPCSSTWPPPRRSAACRSAWSPRSPAAT